MTHSFEFIDTDIPGLVRIKTFCNFDDRGTFIKDYSDMIFKENNIEHNIKETFYSTNSKGVIRGLHFQSVKQQSKLIRCIYGHIWDVVVDLRKDSPTFKKWISFDLYGNKNEEILVPAGCAHGFLALEDSMVSYKCDENFYKEFDGGIIWDDCDIGVRWPIPNGVIPILSEKDKSLQSFDEFVVKFRGGF